MPSGSRIRYKTKVRFNQTWNNLMGGIGRTILVYSPDTENECPNCYYDKVNGASSGVAKTSPGDPHYFNTGRCPVCAGKGVLVTVRRKCIEGVIIWNPSGNRLNQLTHTEAGYEGATKVELKTDPCYLDLIKRAKYMVIDGVKCRLSTAPLLRGIGEQSILVVTLFAVSKPSPDSGETLTRGDN